LKAFAPGEGRAHRQLDRNSIHPEESVGVAGEEGGDAEAVNTRVSQNEVEQWLKIFSAK